MKTADQLKIKGLCEVSEDEQDTSITAEVTPLGPLKSGGRVFTKLQRRISPYSKRNSPNNIQQDQFNRSYYRIDQSGFASINVDQENKSLNVNIMKCKSISLHFNILLNFIVLFSVYSQHDCCNIN